MIKRESIEIWIFGQDAFLMSERQYSNGLQQWECITGLKNENESDHCALIRILHDVFEDDVDYNEKCIERVTDEDRSLSVYLVFLKKKAEISGCKNNKWVWKTLQEIESLHFDETFSSEQFEHYIKYVRNRIWDNYIESKCDAVKRVIGDKKEIIRPKRGLPAIIERQDDDWDECLKRVYKSFEVYGDDLYAMRTKLPESVNNSLGTGNPIYSEIFPPIISAITASLRTSEYSKYPMPAGGITERRIICDYLHREGFSKFITPENIIFTASTTHAFHLILEMIIRPGDVVLFSAPTYGLFAFAPERYGGRTRFVELKEENNWLLNPDDLEEAITSINKELSLSDHRCDYIPRVVAYVNINPHNPIGKVMGNNEADLVKKIATVCRENGVFVIDDLIYRDLCFSKDKIALPVVSFDSELQNSITLMGLSKAYGVAGLRTGLIIADETIVRGVRSSIFQNSDSVSQLNAIALTAAYNATDERYRYYEEYFDCIIREYKFRYNIIKAAVDGVSAVEEQYIEMIVKLVQEELGEERGKRWLQGIKKIHFVSGTEPEAGFFCLVDFTDLLNSKAGDWHITDETTLVKYMFHRYRINFITGGAIGWPKKERLIARFSFSLETKKIISIFELINQEIMALEEK